jgi:hypothetical protein
LLDGENISFDASIVIYIYIYIYIYVTKEVMKWRPLGRRKRGRPKLTWAEGIKGLMGEKVTGGRR